MNRIFASALLVFSAPTIAMQAASTEQVFCGGQVVVIAQVKEGTSEDCRLRMASPCLQKNGMHLSVTVSEVLGVRTDWRHGTYDPSLTSRHATELIGQTLDLHVDASAVPWVTTVDDELGPDNDEYLDNPTAAALTDTDIQRLYVGKSFIFTMLPPNSPGDPLWSNAWPLNSKTWATKVMRRRAGNNCAALLFDHSGPLSGKPTADTPERRALISRLEVQFVHVFANQPGFPTLEQALAGARELNSDLDDVSWRRIASEVDTAVVSTMIAKGTALDLAFRMVFDSLSTPELKRLSGIFADPAFNRFFTSLMSPEIERRRPMLNADQRRWIFKGDLPRLGPFLGRTPHLESLRLAMDDDPIFLDPDIGRVPDPGATHTS